MTRCLENKIAAAIIAFVAALMASAPCPAAAASANAADKSTTNPSTQSTDALENAIKILSKQSQSYFAKPAVDDMTFEYIRPEKCVKEIKPETAPQVLERMLKPISNDLLKDQYVRWHLMPIIYNAPPDVRKSMGKNLIELSKLVPPRDTAFPPRQSWTFEPKELGDRWQFLVNSCIFYKGFPPFQVAVGPPESLALMDATRRKQCEAYWEEAKQIEPKIKKTLDPKANAWNSHLQWMAWQQDEFRGEVYQEMLRSGDPAAFNAAIAAVPQLMKTNPRYGCDFVTFLNACYMRGDLNAYDSATLKAASAKLKQLAIANPKWIEGRNFPEAIFHVVKSIDIGRSVVPTTNAVVEQPKAPTTQPNATTDNLNVEMVNAAIQRATAAMMLRNPPDAPLSYLSWAVIGQQYYPWALIYPGTHALATSSMLAAGESYQSPWMQKRIAWVMSMDTAVTYDRAMRLQVLQLLPRKGWEDWVKRDRDGLVASITNEGNFPERWYADKPYAEGFSENANGQYGVMGLMAAEALRQPVPIEAWKRIDKYWREAQFRSPKAADGGWSQISFKTLKAGVDPGVVGHVSGPMTAAGIMALSQSERFTTTLKGAEVGQGFSPQLLKGIQWLDENFNLEGLDGDQDWFYYMWTVQNVGHATGYRRFKNVDWYREATAKLLNSQQANGLWVGPKSELVSTSFALLYLYRARGPLAMMKLHFTSTDAAKDKSTATSWNNRPNDLVNFADYLTETFETPTSWLVAEPAQPIVELIESPTIYLATDKGFTLNDKDIDKIRAYIEAGGLLVAAPEGNKPGPAVSSMKALAKKLYPDREFEKIEQDHAFYNLAVKVKTNYPMEAISNGIRPLMVIIEKDVGRDLQVNQEKSRDSFGLMANIYLFATGRDSRRPRLASNYVVRPGAAPIRKVAAARIKYDGNFDPEPMALPQLSALMARDHGIDLSVATVSPADLSEKQSVAFLTMTEKANLTDAETAALRQWVDAGGTLWVDVAAGNEAAQTQLEAILPRLATEKNAFRSLNDQRILAGLGFPGGYDVRKLTRRKFGSERGRDPILVAAVDERPAIYVSKVDVACGLAGLNHWGITGYEPLIARRLVINTILVALSAPPTGPAAAHATTTATTGPSTTAANPTTNP